MIPNPRPKTDYLQKGRKGATKMSPEIIATMLLTFIGSFFLGIVYGIFMMGGPK